jgi:hypothetical protein
MEAEDVSHNMLKKPSSLFKNNFRVKIAAFEKIRKFLNKL